MGTVATDLHLRRHRFTVDDYYRMAEQGILPRDARVELIEGEIIDMAAMGTRHAGRASILLQLLNRAVGERALVRPQMPLRLNERNEPEPDVAVVKPRADFYLGSHPTPADTLLVVEVADSTLKDDLDEMVPLYARYGVPEVWVFDCERLHLHVFSAPDAGQYTGESLIKAPEARTLAELPEVHIDLAGLFKPMPQDSAS